MTADQLINLDFRPEGHHAVCDTPDCGCRVPEYRVTLGTFARFLCERCLTEVLL